MTALNIERQVEPAKRAEFAPPAPGAGRLLVVVGFDGSESAVRALDAATRLIAGRVGTIEVVFVGHIPPGAEMSADAKFDVMQGFDTIERELADTVRARLGGVEQRWHFRRRDGLIAHELVAVADEMSRDYGDDATAVIVVGSALHPYHHVVGSVPVALVRHAKYPIVVVP